MEGLNSDMVFLNLVVQKIIPDTIQDFMRAWLRQECRDFRMVFIGNDLDKDQQDALSGALRFVEVLGLKTMVFVASSQDELPIASYTRVLESTKCLPKDKLEVLKLRSKVLKKDDRSLTTSSDISQLFQSEDDVTVAMATQPCRVDSYINVVYELLPQCTRMCICFNGFDEIPKNLPKSSKIIAICANDKNGIKDLGCDNKMYWLGDFKGYYATVDDDIIYPSNYIQSLKATLKKYRNSIITSFHGQVYNIDQTGKMTMSNRRLVRYDVLHEDVWCHRLGMGVAMFHPKMVGLDKSIFLSSPKNTGDDELMALWAQRNNIPMLCASTRDVHLFPQLHLALSTGLCTNRSSMKTRRKMLESYNGWKLNKLDDLRIRQMDIGTEDDVTVAMATQPHRKEQMLKVVEALLPQCTRMCIALNEYDQVPQELLRDNKITVILAGKNQPIKDLGNLNKMLWMGSFPGYYATVDDDLDYFDGYIEKLKQSLKKYGNKVICSFHGLKYGIKNGQVDLGTKEILFYNKIIEKDTVCLRPGMGTAMCHPHTLKLDKSIYLKYPKGNSDDCITSIWAQQHNIPCVVVGRDKIYMDATDYAYNGLYKSGEVQLTRNRMMQSYKNWRYLEI